MVYLSSGKISTFYFKIFRRRKISSTVRVSVDQVLHSPEELEAVIVCQNSTDPEERREAANFLEDLAKKREADQKAATQQAEKHAAAKEISAYWKDRAEDLRETGGLNSIAYQLLVFSAAEAKWTDVETSRKEVFDLLDLIVPDKRKRYWIAGIAPDGYVVHKNILEDVVSFEVWEETLRGETLLDSQSQEYGY